jgi:hypothetical protein
MVFRKNLICGKKAKSEVAENSDKVVSVLEERIKECGNKKGKLLYEIDFNPKGKKHEIKYAKWFANITGKDIKLLSELSYRYGVGAKTSDYLVNGMEFELKGVYGNSINSIEGQIRKALKQSKDGFVGLEFVEISKFYENIPIKKIIQLGGKRGVKEMLITRVSADCKHREIVAWLKYK